ncbi:hypothetical protein T12_8896 [Trichinella patagoniensis]|uniref:Uncharacterized protein n=1 Tax=Trichinella patagoniensis TaxID=990121 RepID=A0A0V0ZIV9_9BILA|nr:hypothetical protein T12_8896 [Trichinella patagoniensis]
MIAASRSMLSSSRRIQDSLDSCESSQDELLRILNQMLSLLEGHLTNMSKRKFSNSEEEEDSFASDNFPFEAHNTKFYSRTSFMLKDSFNVVNFNFGL